MGWGKLLVMAAVLLLQAPGGPLYGQTVVDTSIDVLAKLTSQADRIPPKLLASAHGVAIIPGLVKGGLVVGVRRGNGVILVRGPQGNWQLPSMVTLTGGSVGWQVGIQSTDLVLVFKNRRSVQNLMQGKLTIGVDASAAAGPVGRKAQAATDGRLAAEIYSYSRSRGLFAGVSVDGATLKVDHGAQQAYYAAAPQGSVPPSATRLIQLLNQYAQTGVSAGTNANPAAAPLAMPAAPPRLAPGGANLQQLEANLLDAQRRLQGVLNPQWKAFLELPTQEGGQLDRVPLPATLQRYDQVSRDPRYQSLQGNPDFQMTHRLLQRMVSALAAQPRVLQLPPPPGATTIRK